MKVTGGSYLRSPIRAGTMDGSSGLGTGVDIFAKAAASHPAGAGVVRFGLHRPLHLRVGLAARRRRQQRRPFTSTGEKGDFIER